MILGGDGVPTRTPTRSEQSAPDRALYTQPEDAQSTAIPVAIPTERG